jgi:hypothetical protein
MKRLPYLLAAFLVPLLASADTIEGNIKLTYTDSMFDKSAFTREFGTVVKVTCHWHVGDFFGKETVFASVNVKNTGPKPMFYQYYVAFFDKNKKLVGAAAQGSFGDKGLEPGKETQLGSCLVHLPKDKYKDIVSYEAVFYETDTPPQKKK